MSDIYRIVEAHMALARAYRSVGLDAPSHVVLSGEDQMTRLQDLAARETASGGGISQDCMIAGIVVLATPPLPTDHKR